jgi:glycogen(starch) synthase
VAILDRNMGVNPYAVGLANGLRAAGHDVLIGAGAAADIPGAEAFYPRAGVRGQRVRKLGEAVGGLGRAARRVRAFRPDVVHHQWTGPLDVAMATMLARVVPDAVSVVTVHRVHERGANAVWQRAMLRRASGRVAFASDVADRLSGPVALLRHGNYSDVVEPVGREHARRSLGLSPEGAVLCFIGQIRPDKGLEALFRTAPTGTSLLVAGTVLDRGYRRRLGELERSLGLRVRWLESDNALATDTLVAAACAATAVVLPFADAVQSGSLLFAMTLGSCVLTTDVGEARATVGDDGVVVGAGDDAGLAAAIREVLDDPRAADELGQRARASVLKTRNWTAIALDAAEIYERALTRKRDRSAAARVALVELESE